MNTSKIVSENPGKFMGAICQMFPQTLITNWYCYDHKIEPRWKLLWKVMQGRCGETLLILNVDLTSFPALPVL